MSHSFSSYDGVVLAYTTVGEGPPLICLPGGPGRAAAYLEDLGGLAGQRTLYRLDMRATGRSEVPPDPASLRFDRLAADVEALRVQLGLERADVLGHSAGSMVAQAWAGAHPERVGSLILLTPTDRLQNGARADVPQIRETFRGEPWFAGAVAALEALQDAPRFQQAVLERATRPFMYGRWDERTQAHAATADRQVNRRAMLGFAGAAGDVDVPAMVASLREVTAPVLVIAGGRDALTGVESARLVADCFPGARLEVLPAAGHFPWVDEPAAFLSVAGPFLARV